MTAMAVKQTFASRWPPIGQIETKKKEKSIPICKALQLESGLTMKKKRIGTRIRFNEKDQASSN